MNKLKQYSHKEKRANSQRGASALEGMLLFVALLVGLVIMYPVVQQSLSGRIKETVDAFGHGRQYEPYGNHITTVKVTDNLCCSQCGFDCCIAVLGGDSMARACCTGEALCHLTIAAMNLISQCGAQCITDRTCGGCY